MKKNIIYVLCILLLLSFASCALSKNETGTESLNASEDISKEIEDNSDISEDVSATEEDKFAQYAIGGDEGRWILYPYNYKYMDVPYEFRDYLGAERFDEWTNSCWEKVQKNLKRESFEQLTEPSMFLTIENMIKHFEISKEDFVSMNNDTKEHLLSIDFPLEYFEYSVFTTEEIDALYSSDVNELFAAFPNPYAVLYNNKVYTPGWLIAHTAEDYEAEGIPAALIQQSSQTCIENGYVIHGEKIAEEFQQYTSAITKKQTD